MTQQDQMAAPSLSPTKPPHYIGFPEPSVEPQGKRREFLNQLMLSQHPYQA